MRQRELNGQAENLTHFVCHSFLVPKSEPIKSEIKLQKAKLFSFQNKFLNWKLDAHKAHKERPNLIPIFVGTPSRFLSHLVIYTNLSKIQNIRILKNLDKNTLGILYFKEVENLWPQNIVNEDKKINWIVNLIKVKLIWKRRHWGCLTFLKIIENQLKTEFFLCYWKQTPKGKNIFNTLIHVYEF